MSGKKIRRGVRAERGRGRALGWSALSGRTRLLPANEACDDCDEHEDDKPQAHWTEPVEQAFLKGSNENRGAMTAIWKNILRRGIGLSGIRADVEEKYVPRNYAGQHTGEGEANQHFPEQRYPQRGSHRLGRSR